MWKRAALFPDFDPSWFCPIADEVANIAINTFFNYCECQLICFFLSSYEFVQEGPVMPRSKNAIVKPPKLYCSHCQKEVENIVGDDSQYAVANCLTRPLLGDVIEVSEYQSGIDNGTRFYSQHAEPPIYFSRKGKRVSELKDRQLRDTAKEAIKVLKSYKVTEDGSGLKEPSVAYIVTHLSALRSHLASHFPVLKPKFDEYSDRVRRRAGESVPEDVDSSSDVFPQQADQQPSSRSEVVALEYESGDDHLSSTDVVHYSPTDASNGANADTGIDPATRASDESDDKSAVDEYDDSEYDDGDYDDYDDDSDDSDDVASREDAPVKKELTLRQVFEIIKATIPLNNSQASKMLTIFKNAYPEWRKKNPAMWKKYVTDGALLAAPSPEYLKQKRLRRVVCGLTKEDFVPFHDPVKRKEMLDRYEKTGSTIEVTEKTTLGDMLDFDVEKSLLLESPATLDPGAYVKLLEKVNAARPNLLSPDLLFIVDKAKYNDEQLRPNPERPKMNQFSLKLHSDGVQIAKNASLPECSPISFTIERIFPFDPLTGVRDDAKSLRIPSTMPAVHTISVYHGKGACCLFQYMEHMKSEMCRLSPNLNIVKNKGDSERKLVVTHVMTIADSVERSKRTGEFDFICHLTHLTTIRYKTA